MNSTRDSEPCDADCQPDEEHLASCCFWRQPLVEIEVEDEVDDVPL